MTNRLSVPMEVLIFVAHNYAAVVAICQDIVDKSLLVRQRSLQLALLLHHSPLFFPSDLVVHHLARSQYRCFPSLIGLNLSMLFSVVLSSFSLIYISVLNTFLSMCSSSLLITCPYQFDIPSAIFAEACTTRCVSVHS